MAQEQDDRLSRVERMTLRMSVIQTAIAVTGFVVAIIALYAALNEADAVRKQQQASVWPNLEFHRSYRGVPGSERLDVSVSNTGIGPAKIALIEFFFDGAPLRNWDEAIAAFSTVDNPRYSHIGVGGRVLPPNGEFALVSTTTEEINVETVIALRDAIDQGRLSGRICYCSVFDECWLLVSHSREASPVDQCPKASLTNEF